MKILIWTMCFIAGNCQGTGFVKEIDKTASDRWHKWRKAQKEIPIVAWAYFTSPDETTVEEFKLYKNAGLNLVQTPISKFKNASEAGLNVFIASWEYIYRDANKLARFTEFDGDGSPNITGYMLKDEPEEDLFDDLGRAMEYIYKNDKKNTLPMTTLLGMYYGEHFKSSSQFEENLYKYMEKVHPSCLLSTLYLPWEDGTDRNRWFASEESVRKWALIKDIGMMGFVLATEHRLYREASESDLKMQVYSHLSYGAKGIWYYNYRIKPIPDKMKPGWGYKNAMIEDEAGEPTLLYNRVKSINDEIVKLSPILLKLKSTSIWHTGENIPEGTLRFVDVKTNPRLGPYDQCNTIINTFNGNNFIIGQFKNMDDPNDKDFYVMIVNKRHGKNLPSIHPSLMATCTFTVADDNLFYKKSNDPNIHNAYQYDIKTGKLQQLSAIEYVDVDGKKMEFYQLTLSGGQGILLRFSKDNESLL